MSVLGSILLLICLGGLIIYMSLSKGHNTTHPKGSTTPKAENNSNFKVPISRNGSISQLPLSVSISVGERSAEVEMANDLLKQATAFSNLNDYESAIDCLRRSYKVLKTSSISYPIATYTRLSSYLVRSGKYDEGISEALDLLAWIPERINRDFSHCPPNQRRGIACSEKSQVYHSMSFFASLAKNRRNALEFEVLSHAFECLSLKYYPNGQSRRSKQSRSAWKAVLEKPILKGSFSAFEDDILNCCTAFCKECDESQVHTLPNRIRAILDSGTQDKPNDNIAVQPSAIPGSK